MMLFPFSMIAAGKQSGILGSSADLPINDFLWPGGFIVAVRVTSSRDQLVTQLRCKSRSNAAGNRCRMALYSKTGAGDGTLLELSTDIVNYGTMAIEQLEFSLNQNVSNGAEYWIAVQSESDCWYPYDNAAMGEYANIGNFAFGSFPASFSGVGLFALKIQNWGVTSF